MSNVKLDQALLRKIAEKAGSPYNLQPVRNRALRRARQLGISSRAALILLAKEHNIGYHGALDRLTDAERVEVRDSAVYKVPTRQKRELRPPTSAKPLTLRVVLRDTVELLIRDTQLRDRVRDLILAPRNYDRPISEATKVLEDRIRRMAKPKTSLKGATLINYTFHEELPKTRFAISDDAQEQRGYTQILRGVVASLRNPTHHEIIDTFTREDALSICAFIDVLLRVVDGSTKVR